MKLLIANWKMYGNLAHLHQYATQLKNAPVGRNVQLVVCPPFPYLQLASTLLTPLGIAVGAQTCHPQAEGAFTGDTAAAMVAEVGATYVILGHSERRQFHGEDNTHIRQAAQLVQEKRMTPIICIGETQAEHASGQTLEVLRRQCQEALPPETGAVVVAYEPIWAIGTGQAATPADIQQVHRYLKSFLPETCPLLYGGSVNEKNAADILSLPEVDGLLIGRASLEAASFLAIAGACLEG